MKSYGLTMHPINPIRVVLSTFGNCFVCFLHLGPVFLKVRLPGNLTQNLKNLQNWLCKIVPKESKVVVIEGNYLFSEDHNWSGVFPLLNHTWFIEIDDEVRIERLIARHIRYGKTPEEAEAWSRGSDETNARFIGLTAHRAENLIKLS